MSEAFICPICKEINEAHRNYCKECGHWLLNTNFPVISTKTKSKKMNTSGIPKALKLIYLFGISIFIIFGLLMFIGFLSSKDSVLSALPIFLGFSGVIGMATAVLASIVVLIKKIEQKKGLLILYIASIFSIILAVVVSVSSKDNFSNKNIIKGPEQSKINTSINNGSNDNLADEINVNGVKISDTRGSVIEKLGEPHDDPHQVPAGFIGERHQYEVMNYTNVDTEIFINPISNRVEGFHLYQAAWEPQLPPFSTKKGIRLENKIQDVENKYLQYRKEDHGSWLAYTDKSATIGFHASNKGTIFEIVLFRPYVNSIDTSTQNQIEQERLNETKNSMNVISTALKKYAENHNGMFPKSSGWAYDETLSILTKHDPDNGGKPYLDKLPQDGYGHSFGYLSPNGKVFCIETLKAYNNTTNGFVLYLTDSMTEPTSTNPTINDSTFQH